MACWNMAEDAPPGPLWTQDQAIVYEAALQAIAAREALNVTDTHIIYQALREFSGIVRNRDLRG